MPHFPAINELQLPDQRTQKIPFLEVLSISLSLFQGIQRSTPAPEHIWKCSSQQTDPCTDGLQKQEEQSLACE